MAVEVAPAGGILGEGGHFAHIVEKGSPPQRQYRRYGFHHMGGISDMDDKALALLSALAPFLSERRRTKLDGITKAMTVAGVYKGVKKI